MVPSVDAAVVGAQMLFWEVDLDQIILTIIRRVYAQGPN
jgi:hypothetical protein